MVARHPLHTLGLCATAMAAFWIPTSAYSCDGKSYSLDISAGQIVAGGGLAIQLDKIRLFDKVPDKYTISVKDDIDVLADHVVLVQYDTLSFKTRCGTVTIGADRKSMFSHGTITINWSYF